MKKRLLVILIVLLLVFMVGCSTTEKSDTTTPADTETTSEDTTSEDTTVEESNDTAEQTEKVVIGYSLPSTKTLFNQIMYQKLPKVVEDMKDVAEFIILDANGDANKQVSDVDTLISQQVDVIILHPWDVAALSVSAEAANEAGIPIVEVNTKTNTGDVYFCGSDHTDAGRIQGEYLAEVLPENAKVCYMVGDLSNNIVAMREAGLQETLFDVRPDIELLSRETNNWQRDTGMQIMEDWLQKYPDMDCMISQGDDGALGAIEALRAENKIGEILVAGVDAIEEACERVKDGSMLMTVYQNAQGQVEGAVDMAYQLAIGNEPEKELWIPFELVIQDNVDDYMTAE